MHQPLVCLLVALLVPASLFAADTPPAKTPPKIIIKVDDFGVGKSKTVTAQWQRFADFIKERKIKVNIGFICNSLEPERPEFFQWCKDLQGTGLVEFWLHAYEHKDWIGPDGVAHNEFAGRPYAEEAQRLALCQKLAQDRLGLAFHTFGPPGTGAPGPGVDEEAYKAIQAEPNLKVWLYSSPLDDRGKAVAAQGKITILDRVWQVNIEHPLFKPSAEEFENGYAKYAGQREYFVIQGHPQHWTDDGFAEFVKIVDFATAKGCAFVLASEYAASHP